MDAQLEPTALQTLQQFVLQDTTDQQDQLIQQQTHALEVLIHHTPD